MPRTVVPQDIVKQRVAEIDEEIRRAEEALRAARDKRAAAIVSGHPYRAGDVIRFRGDEYRIDTVSTVNVGGNPSFHARKRNKGGDWSKRSTYHWPHRAIVEVIEEAPEPPASPPEPAPAKPADPALAAALGKAREIASEQPFSQGRSGYESGRVSAAGEIIAAAKAAGG